jgi:primosomal protein N' (replication factor Y)
LSVQPSLYPAAGVHVQVAVPTPVEEAYLYSVPEWMEPFALPGCRVRVAFAGRQLIGVITEVCEAPADLDPRRIRAIDDCLDATPAVPAAVARLALRAASAYVVGPGEMLALCVPPGGEQVGGRRARWMGGDAAMSDVMSDVAAAVAEGLRKKPGVWFEARQLERRFAGRPLHAALLSLRAAGLIELELEAAGGAPGGRRMGVRWNDHMSLEAALALTSRAPRQRELLEPLHTGLRRTRLESEVAEAHAASRAVLSALVDKNILLREPVVTERETENVLPEDGAGTFELTEAQSRALQMLTADQQAPEGMPILLHGVTGSGKTEVYLRAALRALERDQGVLLLVPEIGLTPQLEQRARAVFGDQVEVLHSGMSAGARARAWWRLRSGQARVAVGPRSAVFSPLENVGLIVVDEEQDSAYKQAERPRYHGREIALWRAEIEGATIVLGSATPAIESYAATRGGDWKLSELPRRVGRRPLPKTELVDMRREWQAEGRSLVSRRLEAALAERLSRSEQALVMLNRRGFASAIVCRSCGDRGECPNCAVSLTYHRQDGTVRCHYCDHRSRVPSICGVCGAPSLQDTGHGTQRLQEALTQRFPQAVIERFDADQTQRRGAHAEILGRFGRREIDILVGTQMLAKGHDFAAVTLVGVIDADASLGVPDFRAAERTFQLLTQVSGRAGRGHLAGEVILQVLQPEHYAITAAMNHDYATFYENEIRYRQRLAYPPYSALAVCVCRGKVATAVKEDADRLAAALRLAGAGEAVVLGPASPAIGRLRGKYRLQTLVKGRRREDLPRLVSRALGALREDRAVPRDMVVDIVPDALL